MFDPSTTKSQDCPIDHLKLKARRVVKYIAQGEVREHLLVHENYHLPESKGSLPHLWIGESMFEVLDEHINWDLYGQSSRLTTIANPTTIAPTDPQVPSTSSSSTPVPGISKDALSSEMRPSTATLGDNMWSTTLLGKKKVYMEKTRL